MKENINGNGVSKLDELSKVDYLIRNVDKRLFDGFTQNCIEKIHHKLMEDPWCLEGYYDLSNPGNFEIVYPFNDFVKDFVKFFRKNGFKRLAVDDLDTDEIRLIEEWETLFGLYVEDYLFTVLQDATKDLE